MSMYFSPIFEVHLIILRSIIINQSTYNLYANKSETLYS